MKTLPDQNSPPSHQTQPLSRKGRRGSKETECGAETHITCLFADPVLRMTFKAAQEHNSSPMRHSKFYQGKVKDYSFKKLYVYFICQSFINVKAFL